ncbi:MAG: TIM barrel protein, partial [Candidatus Bathyarchaeia archaeon]
KVDPVLKKYGWGPGAGSNWDVARTEEELRYWREQGFEVVELTADMFSQTGPFFKMSAEEWVKTRAVVERAGLRFHSILAWRRMICRQPWAEEKWRDLLHIAKVSEILSLKVVDVMVAPPGPPWPGPERPMLRGLWDTTPSDFEISAARLKEYARLLARFGASISLEIHEDTIHDTPHTALRLLHMIDEPNVGVNPDTVDNGWIYPGEPLPSPVEQAFMVAPYVNHWHVKQWIRTLGPDRQWQRRPSHADEGTQPIAEMARILYNAGFRGAMIQECGRGDGDESMRRFAEYMHRLIETCSV